MPLTKRQFELRVDEEGETWMRQIYDLLAEHRDLAYSTEELRETFLGDEPDMFKVEPDLAEEYTQKERKLNRVLDVLVGIGAVDQRDVAGTDYYAFLQEFDTNTWVSKKLSF